jgi:hypothetical protein
MTGLAVATSLYYHRHLSVVRFIETADVQIGSFSASARKPNNCLEDNATRRYLFGYCHITI